MCDQRSSESFGLLERDKSLFPLGKDGFHNCEILQETFMFILDHTWYFCFKNDRRLQGFLQFFTLSIICDFCLVLFCATQLLQETYGPFRLSLRSIQRGKGEHQCFHHLFFDQRGLDQEEAHQGAAYPVPSLFQ